MESEEIEIFNIMLDRLIKQVEERVESDTHSNINYKKMIETDKLNVELTADKERMAKKIEELDKINKLKEKPTVKKLKGGLNEN